MRGLQWLEATCGVLASLIGAAALVQLLNIPAHAGGCHSDRPSEPTICASGIGGMPPVAQNASAPSPVMIALTLLLGAALLGVGAAAVWHSRTRAPGARAALWIATGVLAVFAVLPFFGADGPLIPSVALALVACASSLGNGRATITSRAP